jgi:hypothetical protein
MNADDLTKPLKPTPRKQRRGIVLPIVAGTLCGVFSSLVVFFTADRDRAKPLSPTSMSQPALAESVRQTVALPPPALATPTAKTVTVIDSQTGARREVVLPASTDDQLEEGNAGLARSAAVPEGTSLSTKRAKTKKR